MLPQAAESGKRDCGAISVAVSVIVVVTVSRCPESKINIING
jgi:hypothetical protein